MKRIRVSAWIFVIFSLIAAAAGCAVFLSGNRVSGFTERTVEDYIRFAQMYADDGAYQKAAVSYQDALQEDGENITALKGVIEAYIALEYYEEAEKVYDTLLKLEELSTEEWMDYIDVKIHLDKREEAKELVKERMETDDSSLLASLYEQMDVAMPVLDLAEGSYDTYQLLQVEDALAGASIYYTVDGTEPTQGSMAYVDGIVIAAPQTTVKVKAYSPMGYESDTVELNFTITAPVEEVSQRNYNSVISYIRNGVLHKRDNEPLYNYELAGIRSLYIVGTDYPSVEQIDCVFYDGCFSRYSNYDYNKGSEQLDAVRYMTFLKTLAVCCQEEIDLDVLSGLEHLEELSLLNDGITDINALQNLHSLRRLALGWNRITDVSALSGLVNLESLGLWNNQITDISSLGGLSRITYLDIAENQVSDISVIGNFPYLTEVWIDGNPIGDVSVLNDYANIRVIH